MVRAELIKFMDCLYSPKNMALVYVGNLPKNIEEIAIDYFDELPKRSSGKFLPFKPLKQTKPKLNLFYKKTDQANLVLGVESYARLDQRRYAAKVLATILGEGMSSRLFIQVRERRGLAYHISANCGYYKDTGAFTIYGGIKLEKIFEALEVIKAEVDRITAEKATVEELKKVKEMIRGRLAIRAESTNFLAEYFGTNFVLDRKIETFDEILQNIDQVSLEDVQMVAKELLRNKLFNLQLIGPFKDPNPFLKILE